MNGRGPSGNRHPSIRPTRDPLPGKASDPAWPGACPRRSRRGMGGPAATRDAAAVLGAGPCRARPGWECLGRWSQMQSEATCPSGQLPVLALSHLRGQRTPRRRSPGVAAFAVLHGGVHSRGAGEAEGSCRKPRPASEPFFEWALRAEQVRDGSVDLSRAKSSR